MTKLERVFYLGLHEGLEPCERHRIACDLIFMTWPRDADGQFICDLIEVISPSTYIDDFKEAL